nr:MAG TPA: hypothetical protein [Caudoviricetes sp.]
MAKQQNGLPKGGLFFEAFKHALMNRNFPSNWL